MSNVSIFKNVKDTHADDTITISDFIDGVKSGEWQDHVLAIRAETDKKKIINLKKQVPAITVSGTFSERNDASIIEHSGFIAIDIDDLYDSVEDVKYILSQDKYVYAAFSSISGRGLCALFRVEPKNHRRAYESISDYLLTNYKIDVDPSGINESRLRFVSYDPFIHANEKAPIFRKYLPVQKKRKLPAPIVVKNDFDRIVNEMISRSVNCTDDYRDWIKVGFALISEFGESGRDYFHKLSAISGKYDYDVCDLKYTKLMKVPPARTKSSISTIYWYAKNAGIELYDRQTQMVIRSAASQKRNGVVTKSDILNGLSIAGLNTDNAEEIVEQILQNPTPASKDDVILDVTNFVNGLGLKKNLVTRNIEWNGEPINDSDLNSIYLDCRLMHSDSNKDLVQSVIFSNRIPQYNPIMDFLNLSERNSKDTPNLDLLLDSVISDTYDYKKWITKWLVALIATAYGKHSPLMLVLAGEKQGTGKTHWLRYLLPNELQDLYAESKMDRGKDDEILMTKKWIIVDDEMGGKSKKEAKQFKEITSKQWINVREPYGKIWVDLKRTAMFAGTSNDLQLLNDATGNRRYLPIHILDIDQDKYNRCDKSELLWELNSVYKSGYDYSVLKEEIENLNEATDIFKESTPEEELILTYMAKGGNSLQSEWLPISIIIEYLLKFSKKSYLSNVRVGQILTAIGYTKKRKKVEGVAMTVYKVIRLISDSNDKLPEKTVSDIPNVENKEKDDDPDSEFPF